MSWASFGARTGIACPQSWEEIYTEVYKSFLNNCNEQRIVTEYDSEGFKRIIYNQKTKEKKILKMLEIIRKYDCGKSAKLIISVLSPGNKKYEKVYVSEKIFKKAIKILFNFKNQTAKQAVIKYIIAKIEPACFCKSGDRKARWKLAYDHKEYGAKKDCIEIAKKMIRFLFSLKDSPKPNSKLKELIAFKKVDGRCPLCKESITCEDFFRNGRISSFGLQLGHNNPRTQYTPRKSEVNLAHKANNVYWIHRKCNDMQGDSTLKETLNYIRKIYINNK